MATDIGESNIEEINIIEKGGDYGWPNREGNYGITTLRDLKTVYNLTKSDLDLYNKPFAMYDHEEGNAISGGFVYEGDLESLRNKYVFGDIVNGKLFYVNIDPLLTDSAVYELTIIRNGQETNLKELSQTRRLHLRIGYDRFAKQMYVITKADGMIRRISKAYDFIRQWTIPPSTRGYAPPWVSSTLKFANCHCRSSADHHDHPLIHS